MTARAGTVARVNALAAMPDLHASLASLHPMLLGIKWLDPNYLLDQYGESLVWFSIVIIFIECGLFFPFLPGDTLLVSVALFIASDDLQVFGISNNAVEMLVAIAVFTAAAFLGNVAGYEIGRRLGPPIYAHDGRIIKRKYLDQTAGFFETEGPKALVVGRFVPFVRTYITLVAGVTQMKRHTFLVWSGIGAVVWVVSISLIGYFAGNISFVRKNIDYAMIVIGLTVFLPLIWEAAKRRRRGEQPEPDRTPTD
jgi:membrane-associated protein